MPSSYMPSPCCILAGRFPFDHVDHPDPNTRSAQMEVWAQQMQNRWNDVPAMASLVERVRCSPETSRTHQSPERMRSNESLNPKETTVLMYPAPEHRRVTSLV